MIQFPLLGLPSALLFFVEMINLLDSPGFSQPASCSTHAVNKVTGKKGIFKIQQVHEFLWIQARSHFMWEANKSDTLFVEILCLLKLVP